jgi:RHS repeat-associated protein
VRTIRYAGAVEKEEDAQAGTTTIRTYLPGGLGYVQEVVSGTGVAATAEGARVARYFLKDRLGSPIAIMDDSRAVLQRLSYDAWGRRRGADGSDDAGQGLGSLANTQDHSGYTGQEQLDELGLVHLNGRIYDPIVGRMVSADPTVPQPFNPEALNRYSYVYNSPLGYVDPTGYSADGVQTLPLIRVVAQNGENTSGSLQSVGVKSGFAMSVVALPGGAMFELAERKVRQYATGSRIAKVTRYATALARNKQAVALVARLVAKQALKSAVAVALTGGVGTVLVVVSTVDTAHDVWNIMAEAAAQEDAAAQAPAPAASGAMGANWEVPQEAKDKIPSEWGEGQPNRKGEGHRWQDPEDKGSGVRIDKGDPENSQPSQQVDHVVVRDKGRVIGNDGQPINGSIKQNPSQAHIPLSDWLNWSSWNKP